MISITMEMIFRHAAFSLIFGAVLGLFYPLLIIIFSLPYALIKKRRAIGGKTPEKTIGVHIADFVFITFASVVYLLSGYILLDGVFNVFTAFLLVVSFVMSKRFFAKILHNPIRLHRKKF